jgi:hypothetical protein
MSELFVWIPPRNHAERVSRQNSDGDPGYQPAGLKDVVTWLAEEHPELRVVSEAQPTSPDSLAVGARVRPIKSKWEANFPQRPHGPYFKVKGTQTIDGVLRYQLEDVHYMWDIGDLETEATAAIKRRVGKLVEKVAGPFLKEAIAEAAKGTSPFILDIKVGDLARPTADAWGAIKRTPRPGFTKVVDVHPEGEHFMIESIHRWLPPNELEVRQSPCTYCRLHGAPEIIGEEEAEALAEHGVAALATYLNHVRGSCYDNMEHDSLLKERT